jgi:hypothetical protein
VERCGQVAEAFKLYGELPANTTVASLAAPARASGFTADDFAKHIQALKSELNNKLPHDVAGNPQPNFLSLFRLRSFVIGDEPAEVVQGHANNTVKWAVDRLKLDFFTVDPKDILDIWLFKDAASYDKHVALLFGDKPTTPFGYYSPAHKALIMNIDTGGGTLVHEIVHPFIEANFPACPPGSTKASAHSTNSVATRTATSTVYELAAARFAASDSTQESPVVCRADGAR